MKQVVQIRCKNNKKVLNSAIGSTLSEIYDASGLDMKYGPVSAKVNNKVEGLNFRVYHNKDVEYLDLTSPSGQRTYTRTLFMVLCKAVHDLYPEGNVWIDIPVSNGYYCDLIIGEEVTEQVAARIRQRMQEIIDAKLPLRRHECTTEEAIKVFEGRESKVKLLRSTGSLYTTYYDIDGYKDYYYGSLLTNTSQLKLFGLEKYFDGLLLRIPSLKDPGQLGELIHQDKMFDIFKEHHHWQDILGLRTIGDPDRLPEDVKKAICGLEDRTAANTGMTMVIALSYSARWELTEATRQIAQKVQQGVIAPDNINEQTIAEHLATAFMPDPDLLIRTGGEVRLSNYLLWQCAYTELYFCDTFWPDFDEEDLMKAIEAYTGRERRFGKTSEQVGTTTTNDR